jgi:hypothetical protein
MDYLELLKDFNYLSYITAFIQWIFLFLTISVILLIICTRLGLLKRRTKIARYLVKTYYILIPIYFVGFAIKYAPIRNSQIELNNSIDENKQVITDFAYNFVSSIVSDSLLSQKYSAQDIVNQYLDNYLSTLDSIAEPKRSGFFEGFFIKIKRKLEYSFLTKLVESIIIEKSAKLIGVSEKTGKAFYRTDLNELFKEGELVELYKMEMNNYFRDYLRFSLLIFSLGLLIPTTEIILAKIIKY